MMIKGTLNIQLIHFGVRCLCGQLFSVGLFPDETKYSIQQIFYKLADKLKCFIIFNVLNHFVNAMN